MNLYAPFIREATLRVTMTLRSEGHGGDPSPKLQGGYTGPGETVNDGRRCVAVPYGDVIHDWPNAASKRTGDAESDWRPPPDKDIEPGCPSGAKK